MQIRITAVGATEQRALNHLMLELKKSGIVSAINTSNDNETVSLRDLVLDPLEVLKLDLNKRAKGSMINTERFIIELSNPPNRLNYSQISKRLNEFEYSTATGKRFTRVQVKRILDKWTKYYKTHGSLPKYMTN